MKTRVLVIFGACYGILLGGLAAIDPLLSGFFEWNPAADGIDNLLGVLFFVVAILLSMNRQACAVLGGAPDPAAFRTALSDNRWTLIIGIVLITTVINLAATLMSFSAPAGELVWPSPLRSALLSVVYGILARVIIDESVERMRYA